MTRHRSLLLALCLVCSATLNIAAQTTPVDVEIGYRWTDISGNEDMYRTQINEDEGLLIRALTISSVDFGGHAGFALGASEAGQVDIENRQVAGHRGVGDQQPIVLLTVGGVDGARPGRGRPGAIDH